MQYAHVQVHIVAFSSSDTIHQLVTPFYHGLLAPENTFILKIEINK